jgi:hypothetical protein
VKPALIPIVFVALGCGGGRTTLADAAAADAAVEERTGETETAVTCNAAAVAFPQGGTLAPGTLCDELYACADDAAGAARIEATAPTFSCAPGSEPGSACTAYTCAYRNPGGPSTLDAAEIADICAVTLLAPTPPLRCVVFVSAP